MPDEELAGKIAEAGGRVFIGFKDPAATAGVDELGRVLASAASLASAKAQLRALDVDFEIEFIDMPMVVARMPAALLPQVRQNPLIEYVEPIFPGVRLAQTTTWNVQRVNAPGAWSYSTGSGAKLLIIDSGIETTHPDLAPAVVQSCVPYPDNGHDEYGHGTNVAGVAAAVNNDIQIVGVAYGVALWTSKDGNAAPDPAYTACGVQFGRTNNINAINISSSFYPPYTALTDQINAAYNQNGIVIVVAVVAAGNTNGGAVTYPATLDAAIAVSATDINNGFASFSAAGSKVELTAPGAGVTTTCLGGTTCSVNGTSFSAPHVAAAAALLKAYNPSWSNVYIRWRLDSAATDLGPSGRDALFGYGLLNITGAIAPVPPPPGITAVSVTGPTRVDGCTDATWTANTTGGVPPITYQWTVEGNAYNTGTDNHLYYTNSGQAPSIFVKATATDVNGSSMASSPFKTNINLPGAC